MRRTLLLVTCLGLLGGFGLSQAQPATPPVAAPASASSSVAAEPAAALTSGAGVAGADWSHGAVTGTVQPCSGIDPIMLPAADRAPLFFSDAALVTLRSGRQTWVGGAGVYRRIIPEPVVAQEQVGRNQPFEFDHITPGDYFLDAAYTGGNVDTGKDITVTAGKVASIVLPNRCK